MNRFKFTYYMGVFFAGWCLGCCIYDVSQAKWGWAVITGVCAIFDACIAYASFRILTECSVTLPPSGTCLSWFIPTSRKMRSSAPYCDSIQWTLPRLNGRFSSRTIPHSKPDNAMNTPDPIVLVSEKDVLVSVSVSYNVTIDRVKDLLTSAFEGGSNYWIEVAERVGEAQDRKKAPFLCDAPFVKDGYLKIKEDGAEAKHGKGGWFNVDLNTIKNGLRVFSQKYPKHFADFMDENDDATTADVFLQCICFGETIYG